MAMENLSGTTGTYSFSFARISYIQWLYQTDCLSDPKLERSTLYQLLSIACIEELEQWSVIGLSHPTLVRSLFYQIFVPCRYPYITVVMNFSQMWALYCLVQFYNVTHHKLAPIKPLAKFISFKAIVFATWWQGVGIVLLCTFRILPKEGKFQTGLQDFMICIEVRSHCGSEAYFIKVSSLFRS